jgi:hypothetical protein
MRHVTVYTTDKEFSHFVELAKNLHYVKKIETDGEPVKETILNNIKAGIEEIQILRKGNLKLQKLKIF